MSQPPQPPRPSGDPGEPADWQRFPGTPPPPAQPPHVPPPPAQDPYGYPQQAAQYGYPQQPPPPGYGYPQTPAPPDPYSQPQSPYGQPAPGPYGQPVPPEHNPYGQPPAPGQNPYGQPPGQPYEAYGYPQQPPAQPGYPQQPPAQPGWETPQPSAQPGWETPPPAGAPGVAPADPSAPGQAPGPYGYPQQQPYSTVPGAPGGGGGLTDRLPGGRLGALIAGIVAVVVVIAGGVWLLTSGGGSDPQASGGSSGGSGQHSAAHDADGKLLWTVAAPKVTKAQIIGKTPGMWFEGKDVVKQSTTSVNAYDLAGGRAAWTVPAPAGRTCDAAEGVVNNRIALQYGKRCDNVMVIDVATGKLLWHKPLPSSSSNAYEFDDMDMAISGNTVVMTWDDHTVSFQAANGASSWHSNAGDSCQDAGFAGGPRMVEVYKCGFSDDAPYHVSLIDPTSGKPRWTWDAPAGTEVTNVISVDPVVVGISAGSDLITDIWNIDGGRLQGKISLGKGSDGLSKYAIECPPTQMTPCRDVAVSGSTLFMATSDHPGSAGDGSLTNEIAAFDLTDGSGKWLTKDGTQPLDLVALEGGSVIAYQQSSYSDPGQVIKIAQSNGAMSVYTRFAAATQQKERDAYGPGVSYLTEGWHDDYLAMSLTEITTDGDYPDLMAVMH